MIKYNEQSNIGTAKYVVNFHVPGNTHADGSEFYDIAIFRNKRRKDKFVAGLRKGIVGDRA